MFFYWRGDKKFEICFEGFEFKLESVYLVRVGTTRVYSLNSSSQKVSKEE